MEKQIDERTRSNRAEFYGQMATSFRYQAARKFDSFLFYIISAKEYATLKRYERLTEQLNHAISVSTGGIHLYSGTSTAKIKMTKETQTITFGQVDKLRKTLEEQGVKDRYSEQLAKVYEICKKLVIVADKPEPPEEPKQK